MAEKEVVLTQKVYPDILAFQVKSLMKFIDSLSGGFNKEPMEVDDVENLKFLRQHLIREVRMANHGGDEKAFISDISKRGRAKVIGDDGLGD